MTQRGVQQFFEGVILVATVTHRLSGVRQHVGDPMANRSWPRRNAAKNRDSPAKIFSSREAVRQALACMGMVAALG